MTVSAEASSRSTLKFSSKWSSKENKEEKRGLKEPPVKISALA